MDTEENQETFKIILVGDTQVGKTHIMYKFIKDQLPKNPVPTIGIEFCVKKFYLKNGNAMKLALWDTSGNENNIDQTTKHFKGAVGALTVFDLTKSLTFENVNKWIQDIRADAHPDIIIILVGNKLDLVQKNPQERQVETEIAMNYAKELNIKYFEASTFTGESVKEIFDTLMQDISKEGEIKQ